MARKLSEDLILHLYADSTEFVTNTTKAANSLRGVNKEGDKTGTISQQLAARLQQAGNQAAIFLGPLDGLSGRLNASSTAMRNFGLGTTVVASSFAAIIAISAKALKVFTEQELSLARNEAMLRATGSAAGFSADELDRMARSIAMNTLASTEGVRRAQQVLMSFRNVYDEVFTRTLSLSQDLAELYGSSIESEVKRLGKALENPLTGLRQLNEIGIRFNDTQQKQLETLVAQNRMYEAQNMILDAVQARVGGIAESVASGSIAGSVDSFGQYTSEFLEALAKQTGLADAFKDILDRINRGLKKTNEVLTEPALYSDLATAQQEAINSLERLTAAEAAYNSIKDNKDASLDDRYLAKSQLEYAESQYQIAVKSLQEANNAIIADGQKHKAEFIKLKQEQAEAQRQLEAERLKQQSIDQQEALDKLMQQIGDANAREEEIINQKWAQREKDIDNLVLTQELKQFFADQGIETEEGAKEHLRQLNDAWFNEEFAKLQEAEQRKLDAKNRAREQELAAEKRHQEQLARAGSRDEAQLFREQLDYLESEWFPRRMALLEEYTAARKAQIQELEISEQEKTARIEKLEDSSSTAKLKLKRETEVKGEQEIGNALVLLSQSKNRKVATMARAAMVAQTVMKTYEGAMAAYASASAIPYVGWILGPAAAAAVVAVGMANVQRIRSTPIGQFHAGIDNVPKTGDYTLLEGERVLDKRLNADLKQYMKREGGQGGYTWQGDQNFFFEGDGMTAADRVLSNRDTFYGLMQDAMRERGQVMR